VRLIDADELYEKTAKWEAQALHMVEVTMHDEDKTEWRRWSAVLTERSAFKHDIADAPTIELPERKKGTWGADGECPFCGYLRQWDDDNFCANCGADLRGEQE
jgi:hypothetical protein